MCHVVASSLKWRPLSLSKEKKSSICFLQLIFVICSHFINHHSVIVSFIAIQQLTELLSNKHWWSVTAVTTVPCLCVCACVRALAACRRSVPLLRKLPTDSVLFYRKLSGVKQPVLCIKSLFGAEQSEGVLEDTAPRWVCLGYQSKRLRSAANNLKFSNIPRQHS